MCNDKITVWRNEFDVFINKGGEGCLCEERTVSMAIELENKIRTFENSCD